MRRLCLPNLTFVELGSSDGQENCTRLLLESGSTGLWVEGDCEKAALARELFPPSSLEVVDVMIDCSNIMKVIDNSELVRMGFDLLVVDVDGNDWWLLKKILGQYSPRIIVTEYNPAHGPRKKWVMPYDASHTWNHDQIYGASLSAYNKLLSRHGYQLIGCDPSGTNAFWVQNKDSHFFGEIRKPKELLAQAPIQRMHPKVRVQIHERHFKPDELVKIEIINVKRIIRKVSTKSVVVCEVINNLDVPISSAGDAPIRVALRYSLDEEPIRAIIQGQISPGKRGVAFAELSSDEDFFETGIVQEGVCWTEKWKRL